VSDDTSKPGGLIDADENTFALADPSASTVALDADGNPVPTAEPEAAAAEADKPKTMADASKEEPAPAAPAATGGETSALPEPGQVIAGKYTVSKKLGEGGFGAVYIAQQEHVDRPVVIKALHPQLTANPEMVQRFLVEAKASSKVRHPNVVTIYDFGYTDAGMGYLVMELIEGEELNDLLKAAGRFQWRRTLKICASVAGALAEAHAINIVHRDIKPQNVMLTRAGADTDFVKVLDFGIAKLREGQETKLTQTGMVMGTPSYMSPEQLEGQEVGPPTDTYALGCMMSRMLTGSLPFKADTMTALIVKHLTEEPPVPSKKAPDAGIPKEVDALVMACMAKKPKDRPSMADLQQQIHAILDGGSAAMSGGGGLKMAVAAVALVAVGAVAAVALSGGGAGDGPTKKASDAPAKTAKADDGAKAAEPKKVEPKAEPLAPLPELKPGTIRGYRLDGVPIEGR